ncbi:MAG: phosphopantothenate/pantothenate synthetase [Promethearchaeota archaeon]|jgi:4-phosphopantoate--beta-alanine ligase
MKSNENQDHPVPKSHPRYESLKFRHKIIEGMKKQIVAEAGLIAHGRGECFDYILGEKTTSVAKKAIEAAVAALLIAEKPVISVNGNVAALIPDELVALSKIVNAPLEINLFYQKEGRIEAIKNILLKAGAAKIYGTDPKKMIELNGLESNRRKVELIAQADLVMVPLEDGDRTEALRKLNKKIIAVDLNPISRTSLWADITIVDNIVRAIPEMIKIAKEFKKSSKSQLENIVKNFNNKKNIHNTLNLIIEYIKKTKEEVLDAAEI